MSVSLHRFTRTFMEFLSCSVRSSFPEQGVTSYSSYTLQRCVTLPMRDQILDAQPGESFPSTLPMVWGPVDDPSQSMSFSATPHTPQLLYDQTQGRPFPVQNGYTLVGYTQQPLTLVICLL